MQTETQDESQRRALVQRDSTQVAVRQLAVLGRLSACASNQPPLTELCRVTYDLLRSEMPVDACYFAAAQPHGDGLHGVLVMDLDEEYPPSSVYIDIRGIADESGTLLRDEDGMRGEWTFGSHRHSVSGILCYLRSGSRLVGQISIESYSAYSYTEDDVSLVRMIGDQLCMAFGLQLATLESQRREEELRALLESSHRVNRSLDLDEVLSGLARSLEAASGADAVLISRWDTQTRQGMPVARHSIPGIELGEIAEPFDIQPHSEAEYILRTRQSSASALNDELQRASSGRWLDYAGWYAQLTLPLVVRDEIIGLIEIGSQSISFRFTGRQIDLCQTIVEQAAVGIQHAQVYQHAVDHGAFLSSLAQVATAISNVEDDLPALLRLVCREASALLAMDHAALFLIDPTEERLLLTTSDSAEPVELLDTAITVDAAGILAMRAIREGTSITSVDLGTDVGRAIIGGSALATPLRHHGATLGVLVATASKTRVAFHAEELRLAEGLADQTAAALARARIRAVEQERLQIASVLGTISASIGEEGDLHAIYELILRQAASLIPYDEASITLLDEGMVTIGAAMGSTLAVLPGALNLQRLWHGNLQLDMEACCSDPGVKEALGTAKLRSLLSLPLLVSGIVVGRITFAHRHRKQYGRHQAQLGILLAERTAQVVRLIQLQRTQEAALSKLTALDALRRDFMATVSHELRTPLTGILGYIELLTDRWSVLTDDRRLAMLQRAQSSAARLEHLVTDLLLFSRVEHQDLQLQFEDCELQPLIEQAVQDISTRYRNQTFDLRPAARQTKVHVDPQRTIQVVANLLDNAVKYSAEGMPVHLRWKVSRHNVEVSVRDHGPGINMEDQSRLFTRFGTLGHQPRPGQVGTGIGLYICKQLVEAMGGQISLSSKPGKGTIFSFTVPRVS